MVSGRAYEFLKRHFPDVVEIQGAHHQVREGRHGPRRLAAAQRAALTVDAVSECGVVHRRCPPFRAQDRVLRFRFVRVLFRAGAFELPIVSIDNQQIIHKCKHDKAITKGVGADYRATRAFVKAKLPGVTTTSSRRFSRRRSAPSSRSRLLRAAHLAARDPRADADQGRPRARLPDVDERQGAPRRAQPLSQAQVRRVRASPRRRAGQLRHPQFSEQGFARISLRRARW